MGLRGSKDSSSAVHACWPRAYWIQQKDRGESHLLLSGGAEALEFLEPTLDKVESCDFDGRKVRCFPCQRQRVSHSCSRNVKLVYSNPSIGQAVEGGLEGRPRQSKIFLIASGLHKNGNHEI